MFRGLLILLLAAAPLHAAEVYRWMDAQGRVSYSDQPPPPSARQTTLIKSKGNVVDVDKETYEARVAREKNPVVLYSSGCGPICDQASDYLASRGVPYTLKDPSKEPEIALELKKLVGVMEVPVILVGKTHQKGFEPSSWNSLLDAAGYPKSAASPKSVPSPKAPPPPAQRTPAGKP
jgi:glutaredoxin